MKKKTVITTEKHEVWVIRQPSGEDSGVVIEQDPDKTGCSVNSIAIPGDELVETDMLSDEQN